MDSLKERFIKNRFSIAVVLMLLIVTFISQYSLSGVISDIHLFNISSNHVTNDTNLISSGLRFDSRTFNNSVEIKYILTTIATVLAGILAIVFSISLFNIQIISEKYTTGILDYYAHDKIMRQFLYISLLTIFASISLLFVHKFLLEIIQYYLLLMIFTGVTISICLFVKYFYRILELINPIKLAELLSDNCKKSIEEQKEQDVKNIIISSGDIAIKSIKRHEEDIANKYIESLYTILEHYFMLYEKYPEKYKPSTDYACPDNERNNVFCYVLEEYYRIFKEAVLDKQENITREVISKLYYILDRVLSQKDDAMLKQLIDTRHINGTKYYQFCKFAIKHKDASRFDLISKLTFILQHSVSEDRYNKMSLNEFIDTHLFRINKLIIDSNDFELFEREIDNLCFLSVDSPLELQEKISHNLYSLSLSYDDDKIFNEKLDYKTNHLRYLIKYKQNRIFTTNDEFDKEFIEELDGFRDFIIEHIEKSKKRPSSTNENGIIDRVLEIIEKDSYGSIKSCHHRLFISSRLYKIIFVISAYIIFNDCEDRIKNAGEWICELWTHTKRKDSDTHWGNDSPVNFNTLWLTNLYLYGGNNAGFWTFNYNFGSFHGNETYIKQYYLLSIARTCESLDIPSKSSLEKLKNEKQNDTLNELYLFSNNFLNIKEELLSCCDELIKDSKKWNILFEGKAKEKLEATKDWINKNIARCEELKEEIELVSDIDVDKKRNCKEGILKSYKKVSLIEDIAKARKYNKNKDKGLEFIQIGFRPLTPKHCFINPSNVDCNRIWSEFGRSVAHGEINHFLKRLSMNKQIRRIQIKKKEINTVYEYIVSTVMTMKKEGYNPTVIFIPLDILYNNNFIPREVIEFNDKILKINKRTKLKIISSSKSVLLKDIIILDKKAGVWIYKPDAETKERLQIDVNEHKKDKKLVDILIRTVISYQINKPKAIKRLIFSTR